MRLGIIGSGALASLFAAKLAPHTAVTMLGHWPEQAQTLRERGLTLHVADEPPLTQAISFVTDADDLPPLDVALVLVKAGQTERAGAELAAALQSNGVAVTLQNGLGCADVLARILGPERVAQGVTAQGATMLAPGHVRHAGQGATVLERLPSPVLLAELAVLLNRAGLETNLTADIQPHVWGKLVVNAAINPLTALLRVRNGFLAAEPMARAAMAATAVEAATVAAAQSITLPFADPAARASEVAVATAENISSMLQDALRGTATEIDVINGAVAGLARAAGTPAPLNTELWRMVRDATATGIWPGSSRLPQLEALLSIRKEAIDDRYRVD